MQCPTCGGANVDGAKFCGVCGHRLAEGPPTVPPGMKSPLVTAETRSMAGAPPRPLGGSSLGESLRVPGSPGARGVKIALVLALDVGLVIAGFLLMTGGGGGGEADAAGNVAVVADGGLVAEAGRDAAAAAPIEPAGPRGGGTSGTGGGGGTSGTGGGTTGTGSTDAAVMVPLIVDSGTATTVTADAAVAVPAIDAAVTEPAVDAAATEPVLVDAAADPADAAEAAVSFNEIRRHLARLVAAGDGRRERCYQNATKALPADQPLSGEVDIGLAVMPTGAVQNVRVSRNTTGSNDLAACVLAGTEDWTFPPHTESDPVELEQRFRFGPGAQ